MALLRSGPRACCRAPERANGVDQLWSSGGTARIRSNNFAVEGQTYLKDKDYPNANSLAVTPNFFATVKTPIVQGRAFTDADRVDALPVAIVNRAFVKKYFPNVDPIGRRIRMGGAKSTAPWSTIVGVAGDMFSGNQDNPFNPAIFQPFAQARSTFVYIAARTAGPPLAITQGVREAVATLNPDIPLYWVQPFEEAVAQSLWFVRVFGAMFMIFGFVALFLASVGLYAVMSFSVSRRTREVGIRMALGARGSDVVGMIFGQGLWQLGIGMAVGPHARARNLAAAQDRALPGAAARSGDLRRGGHRADHRWVDRVLGTRAASNFGRSARRAAKRLIGSRKVRERWKA
jgi:putative ABC transport system permease protein